jgi:hypothetical protein
MANPTPTTTWSYVQITSSTNLGPMPTAVEFPPDCTNMYNFRTTVLGASWSTVYTGGCAMSTCCPYSNFYTTAFGWYSSYYSPAVCPQGYQTCRGPWEVASTLGATEHVKFCCPTFVPSLPDRLMHFEYILKILTLIEATLALSGAVSRSAKLCARNPQQSSLWKTSAFRK